MRPVTVNGFYYESGAKSQHKQTAKNRERAFIKKSLNQLLLSWRSRCGKISSTSAVRNISLFHRAVHFQFEVQQECPQLPVLPSGCIVHNRADDEIWHAVFMLVWRSNIRARPDQRQTERIRRRCLFTTVEPAVTVRAARWSNVMMQKTQQTLLLFPRVHSGLLASPVLMDWRWANSFTLNSCKALHFWAFN